MRTGHYTRLKGRVTYFRRKVPEFLQERLASTEICYRLGVISSGLAERLGRRLAVEVDDFFQRAKIDPMLNSADLTKLVTVALAGWREDDATEVAQEIQRYGRPLLDPKEQAKAWAHLAIGLIKQVSEGGSAYDQAFVADIAKSAGIAAGDDQDTLATGGRALSLGLAAHYLKSAVETAAMHGLTSGRQRLPVEEWQSRLSALEARLGLDRIAALARLDGRAIAAVATGRREALPAATVHQDENRPPEGSLSQIKPTDQPSSAPSSEAYAPAIPFSELVHLCLATRIAGKEVSADINAEMRSSLRIWTEVVGDRGILSYKRADFLKFRSVLQQVPRIYWKSDASRKLSIQEVIAWARADSRADWMKTAPAEKRADHTAIERAAGNYARVGNGTINRHLSTISPVFDWALDNHYLPEDTRTFWNNLHLPTGLRVTGLKPNEERPAYSHIQIQRIAKHPVWLGRRSDYFYNAPGPVIIRDSLYWGFPIALLHGMRREEFAQLGVRHIQAIDGVWVFDLHAHDLKLKNGPSRRYVPLHSWMLRLGFIEAMVEGRDPQARLFPELSADGELDKLGDALGKRFARILDHSGIVVMRKNATESDGGFHPLRHRFITDLLSVGVREGLVDYLSGHSSGARERERDRGQDGERERYTEDPPITKLKEAIERLPVSVDFQSWIEAWQLVGKLPTPRRR
jgi:integrase